MSGGKGIDMEKTFWYKDAVIYQIWPRSFKDADGDGVGDLMGVYEKLDYLKSLHVDAIWFSPLYPSPNADFGYDVADYMDISAEYGGMAAFKKVLDGAHERGIRVIMDLVVNHTSDEHPWFQASRRGEEPYLAQAEKGRHAPQQLGQHVRGQGVAVRRGAQGVLSPHFRHQAARPEYG